MQEKLKVIKGSLRINVYLIERLQINYMKKNNSTATGIAWKTVENIAAQAINFIIQMFLARLLLPEDFGVVAILNIFISIANTLVQNGLVSSILQKKDADNIDYCTVFYVELLIAVFMYGIIYITAPYISNFYGNISYVSYLRVFSLTVIISALSSVQTTALSSRLDFKSSCIANLIGVVFSGITGVLLALSGYGVWSLIFSQLVLRFITFVFLFLFARWLPEFKFSFKRLKQLFSYSWKLFLGWLIGTIYSDAFSLIIGKVYDEKILGFYSKGNSIPATFNRTVTQTTTSVMFPTIAKMQDDKQKVKEQTRIMISVSVALTFFVMAGIAAVAEPFVMVFLTSTWRGAIPVIQILSISNAINVISNANMQSFNAIGRSDVFLKCEMIKRGITICLLLITSQINFYLMLLTIVFMGFLSVVINSFFNIKLLNYSLKEQIVDILPYAFLSILFFGVIYSMNLFKIGYIKKLVLQISLCVIIYIICVFTIKLDGFKKVKETLLSFLKQIIK